MRVAAWESQDYLLQRQTGCGKMELCEEKAIFGNML